jgi:hypothetical protein
MLIDEAQAFPLARREQPGRIFGDRHPRGHISKLTARARFRLRLLRAARCCFRQLAGATARRGR